MLVFIYQAALYCEACGAALCAKLDAEGKRPAHADDESTFDSDDYPKGPCEEGESDSPSYCDACGLFLESTLTRDGRAYVRELIADVTHQRSRDRAAHVLSSDVPFVPIPSEAIDVWAPFYGFDIVEAESEAG